MWCWNCCCARWAARRAVGLRHRQGDIDRLDKDELNTSGIARCGLATMCADLVAAGPEEERNLGRAERIQGSLLNVIKATAAPELPGG